MLLKHLLEIMKVHLNALARNGSFNVVIGITFLKHGENLKLIKMFQ